MKKSQQSLSNLKVIGHTESFVNAGSALSKNTLSPFMFRNKSCTIKYNPIITRSKSSKATHQHVQTQTNQHIRKSIRSYLQTNGSDIYEPVIHTKNSNLTAFTPQFYRQLKSGNTQKRIKTEEHHGGPLKKLEKTKNENQLNLLEILPKNLINKESLIKESKNFAQKLKMQGSEKSADKNIKKLDKQKDGKQDQQISERELDSKDNLDAMFQSVTFSISGQKYVENQKILDEKDMALHEKFNRKKKNIYQTSFIDMCEMSVFECKKSGALSSQYQGINDGVKNVKNLCVANKAQGLLEDEIGKRSSPKIKRVKTENYEYQMNELMKNNGSPVCKSTIIERLKNFQITHKSRPRIFPKNKINNHERKDNPFIYNPENEQQKQYQKIPQATLFVKSFKKNPSSIKATKSSNKMEFSPQKTKLQKKYSQHEQLGNKRKPMSLNVSMQRETVTGWDNENSKKHRVFQEADLFMDEQQLGQYLL